MTPEEREVIEKEAKVLKPNLTGRTCGTTVEVVVLPRHGPLARLMGPLGGFGIPFEAGCLDRFQIRVRRASPCGDG